MKDEIKIVVLIVVLLHLAFFAGVYTAGRMGY
ncbi:hypothetical protein SEA_VIEENROSE_55 [Streptomyces phage VieEnRose]|nr:membrane protein [Streptomyces phage Urza]QJD50620.1 membrane protein [Streptomyces phage Itza]USH45890.1 hypothetical protein SEA_VIEENROSE_55 [Streptomyces phage VieEnRose]